MSAQDKFNNFKSFVKEISRNEATVSEYEQMSWLKMQSLAYVFLLPNKNNIDAIVRKMQEKLDFDDEHYERFKQYIMFFIEYLSGTNKPQYMTATNLSYEQRLKMYLEEQKNMDTKWYMTHSKLQSNMATGMGPVGEIESAVSADLNEIRQPMVYKPMDACKLSTTLRRESASYHSTKSWSQRSL